MTSLPVVRSACCAHATCKTKQWNVTSNVKSVTKSVVSEQNLIGLQCITNCWNIITFAWESNRNELGDFLPNPTLLIVGLKQILRLQAKVGKFVKRRLSYRVVNHCETDMRCAHKFAGKVTEFCPYLCMSNPLLVFFEWYLRFDLVIEFHQ